MVQLTFLHVLVLEQGNIFWLGRHGISWCLRFAFLWLAGASSLHVIGELHQNVTKILVGLGFLGPLLLANQKKDGPDTHLAKALHGSFLVSTSFGNFPTGLELLFCKLDFVQVGLALQSLNVALHQKLLDVVLVPVAAQHCCPHGNPQQREDLSTHLEVGVAHGLEDIMAHLELDVEVPAWAAKSQWANKCCSVGNKVIKNIPTRLSFNATWL